MGCHATTAIDRASRGRGAHAVAALVLSGLLWAVIAAAGTPRAVAAEAGVNITATVNQSANLKTLGTHWVRYFVSWRSMQPSPGAIEPSALASWEQVFAQLPPGTKVILDVVDSPQWETGSPDEHTPPANPSDYAAFVGALAQRFGTKVAAYEIWNEEDAPGWWTGAPNPTAYAQLLEATYPVVKAADPSATVVLGGLTGNDYQFLEGVYQAGAKGSFDAVAVHTDTACNKLSPYEFLRGPENRMVPDSFLAYREVHAVMVANGDDKPIWMTELSWRTTEATCDEGAWAGQTAEGVSEEQQATFLRQAYHCMAEDPYVQVALWFPLEDEGVAVSGLLRADGSRKPSFNAMREYAKHGDQLSEPCGQFSGPKISIASPANHTIYSGPLPINVSATDPEGVFRIRLEWDGKLIRNYDGSEFPTTLSGAIEWQGAKHIPYGWHTLTFLAYDKERNVSQVSIEIYHARPGSKTSVKGGKKGGRGHKSSSKRGKHHHKRH
jgi:hypothetical protein